MDEVEKRTKIMAEEWNKLPEEDKEKFRNLESTITGISQLRESEQFKQRA